MFARDFSDDGGLMLRSIASSSPHVRYMSALEYADRLAYGQTNLSLYDNVVDLLTDETSFLDDKQVLELMGALTAMPIIADDYAFLEVRSRLTA